MSTAIGVTLFVIGCGALLLSVLMDRRPPSQGRRVADRAAEEPDVQTSGAAQAEEDVALGEPEIVVTATDEPEAGGEAVVPPSEPERAAHLVPEPAPASAEDRASAAQARLAALRAELVGSPEPGPEPDPVAPPEASIRTDADRVFAAVASVGRAPEEDKPLESEGLPPAVAEAEAEAVAEAEEPPGAGHRHAVPLVNHSDLVTHLRREHPDLESSGSTIQMRILHERAHASSD